MYSNGILWLYRWLVWQKKETRERKGRGRRKRKKERQDGQWYHWSASVHGLAVSLVHLPTRLHHVVKVDPSGRSGSVYGNDCRPRTEVNKFFFDGYHRKRSIFINKFPRSYPGKSIRIWVERHGNESHGRNILMGFCLEARKRDPDPLRPLGRIHYYWSVHPWSEASGFSKYERNPDLSTQQQGTESILVNSESLLFVDLCYRFWFYFSGC